MHLIRHFTVLDIAKTFNYLKSRRHSEVEDVIYDCCVLAFGFLKVKVKCVNSERHKMPLKIAVLGLGNVMLLKSENEN